MSIPIVQSLNTVTQGIAPDDQGSQLSLITGGLFTPSVLSAAIPTALETTPTSEATNALSTAIISQLGGLTGPTSTASLTNLATSPGNTTIVNGTTVISTNGVSSTVTSLSQLFNPYGSLTSTLPTNTYTGTDLRIIVDLVDAATVSNTAVPTIQLIQCSTFTVSIHREKAPVRALGYINPKGFARGKRTIAGTLILTQFTIDTLYTFLMAQQTLAHDTSKDSLYVKVDQLPPFNMTLLFADEYGDVSYRRVLGVDMVDDGVVYSTNDMYSEQTVVYSASDFTPLLTINDSALFTPDKLSKVFAAENTVQSYLKSQSNSIPASFSM
jgi:hypothetical protein